MDKDSYQKIINELGRSELKKLGVMAQEETSQNLVPNYIKNRPVTNIYGIVKQMSDDPLQYSSLKKSFEGKMGYNAHSYYPKQKAGGSRNILKAKMEIRTQSDSNDNEYNLILQNDRSHMNQALNSNNIKLNSYSG